MVVHTGEIGRAMKDLESDIRLMLCPYTYMKLRVHSKNKLKDFTDNAGLVDATMMILLRSNLDQSTFSICRFPRGPTLHFNIVRYALITDVHKNVERTASVNKTNPWIPFPVMTGFTDSKEDQAMVSMFQGLFPSIDMEKANLSGMKRVVEFSKEEDGLISIRHYMIERRDPHLSAALRNIDEGKVTDLSKFETVEDYVQSAEKNKPKKNICAIKLKEIGPRIDMMFKNLELGIFNGAVLTEEKEHISKTKK